MQNSLKYIATAPLGEKDALDKQISYTRLLQCMFCVFIYLIAPAYS